VVGCNRLQDLRRDSAWMAKCAPDAILAELRNNLAPAQTNLRSVLKRTIKSQGTQE
jgi:hypothetical protein